MKQFSLFILFLSGILCHSFAQQMTFSEYNKKDNVNILFEILGKFEGNFLVYKNISRQHIITKYDSEMRISETIKLDFLPERVFNVDFITYPTYFFMIYQYQKNNIVYCNGLKIGADGKKLTEPITLDTTKIGFFADNKIYSTVFSEDKQKILIYKRHLKYDNLVIATRLFNADFNLIDSSRQLIRFDERKEVYSDLFVDNNGTFLFAKETKKRATDNSSILDVILRPQGIDSFSGYSISLQKKYIEEVSIKIDNLNKKYIVNSFYYGSRRGSIEGLFTAFIDMNGVKPVKTAFNLFADSLRAKINSTESYKFVFDNLSIRNVVVKRNGGFVIAAEDFYTETLSSNNAWNRNYYYNNIPYSSASDYYLYDPYYYGYRPWSSFNRDQTTRHYYDDVVVASVDSSLKLEWNSIIHKKQYDVDNDNFLSYSIMNAGGEIHFFFIDKDKQKQIISNHSVFPTGEVKRYATLKSNENSYAFMPRLAKQVGARQMIVPYIYLSRIGFAKIDF